LLEDDVPDNVSKDRANEIMELQSQISWDFKPRKVGKYLNVSSIEKKVAILW
jgi:ribosomal protein S12 methylthiotransferase